MRVPYYNFGKPTNPTHVALFPSHHQILLPRIKVVLRYQQRKTRILALVDSGSEYCLFPKDIADLLGINVTAGPRLLITGIGNSKINFFFHEIEILLDKYYIKTKVGFATSGIGTSGLLGQQGFFEHFLVSFNYRNNYIEFKKPGLINSFVSKLGI